MKEETNTVPKIIHYVWLGGGEKKPEHLAFIETWKKNLPDYEIKEWNESNFDVNCCDFIKEAYERKKFAFVSDYIRLKVLYEYGGVYLDTDVEVLKPFDDFLSFDSVLGFENSAYLSMGTIISKPRQKWLKEHIEYYDRSHFINGNKLDTVPNTIKITAFLNKKFGLKMKESRQSLDGGIEIFPCEYFSPKDFTTGKTKVTENTYSVHRYEGSWTGGKGFLFRTLWVIRYIFGKRIFAYFTGLHMKKEAKRLGKEF